MNSGRFEKNVGRIRPGTYVNVDSNTKPSVSLGAKGSVMIPLVNNWGPNETLIKIEADNITAADALIGDSVGNILLLNEAFKGASTVIVYNMNKGEAAKATKDDLTITAKYPGTRGNDIKVTCAAIPDEGFAVSVILGTDVMEEFEAADMASLKEVESQYVVFTGAEDGTLAAFASVSLTGGTSTAITKGDITKMLDAVEDEQISAMAFPFAEEDMKAVALSKARYLRDKKGKSIQIVVADYQAADYEGVINVTNAYQRSDGTVLTNAQATAYVAAITAAANCLVSNTHKVVVDADLVIGKKNNEEAEAAILKGEFFFTQEGDQVIVEYDINSLHTFTQTRSKSYSKNKVLRVYDEFSDTLRATFPPNKFPNSTLGWDLMDGLCQTILQNYLDMGAIKNVDLSNDLKVNRGESDGDSVSFDAMIHAVDAAEKLYFTVITD